MFDYHSLSRRVGEQEFVVETRVTARVRFTSAAALKVAVDLGMLHGMSMTWDYLVGYVQGLQAK